MMVGSIETDAMYRRGFHASLCAETTAWMKNFGVAKSIRVSARDAFSLAICEVTSEPVNSYDCLATIFGPLPAIARVSPVSMSRPSSVFS